MIVQIKANVLQGRASGEWGWKLTEDPSGILFFFMSSNYLVEMACESVFTTLAAAACFPLASAWLDSNFMPISASFSSSNKSCFNNSLSRGRRRRPKAGDSKNIGHDLLMDWGAGTTLMH